MIMATVAVTPQFVLPPELEAHEPPEARGLRRDQVRLMVGFADRDIVHARFFQLPAFLHPGDLVVVNESATLPAALRVRRADGSEIVLHLSTQLPAGLQIVEPRQAQVTPGERLLLPENASAAILTRYPGSQRLWLATLDLPAPLIDYLHRWGKPIAYPYVHGEWPIEMYQTVYAARPGSAEMPSAGRAFTLDTFARLAAAGVQVVRLVLHAGVASPERDEPPTEEYFEVPAVTADAVNETKSRGCRVIAVGTTVVRALESAVDEQGRVVATRGWTNLVIARERGLRVVDGLLTGFHEPKSTHLAMLEAIAGPAEVARAYSTALDAGYLWHEFGDLHLLLP